MKLHKEYDVVVPAGETITSPAFHIPPRYNGLEFITQLVDGVSAYDAEIQGLETYPSTTEMYGAASTVSQAQETDWITLMSETGIAPDHDFTTQASSYGYYRVNISSAGNVTVRLYVIGIG